MRVARKIARASVQSVAPARCLWRIREYAGNDMPEEYRSRSIPMDMNDVRNSIDQEKKVHRVE